MARGGYRPGSGPAKGTKYKTKKTAVPVVEKPIKTRKPKSPEAPKDDISNEDPLITPDNYTPLEYMQKVMNDPAHDTSTRLRAASLAAPFMHSRKGEGNKKKERGDRAVKAGTGKFAASPPPLRVIK